MIKNCFQGPVERNSEIPNFSRRHPTTITSICFNKMPGTPPLVVPEIAGFSEQTYKFGAFVPVFDLFSEQIFLQVRSTVLFSVRSAE